MTPAAAIALAMCGLPTTPPAAIAVTCSQLTGTPRPASRSTMALARDRRLARILAHSAASAASAGSNRYPSRCTLWPSSRPDISIPGTSVSPVGSEALASACPATVSWSVSATTSSPAARARAIISPGGQVPSEAVLWQCRSARTYRRLAGQMRRLRPEGQVQLLARVAKVTQRKRLDKQHPGRVRPQHQPEPASHDLAGERRPPGRFHVP